MSIDTGPPCVFAAPILPFTEEQLGSFKNICAIYESQLVAAMPYYYELNVTSIGVAMAIGGNNNFSCSFSVGETRNPSAPEVNSTKDSIYMMASISKMYTGIMAFLSR